MVPCREGGGILLFPLLSKNIMLFPKHCSIPRDLMSDYSHQQLRGIMNCFHLYC